MSTINELILKSAQMTSLLREYKSAKIYEKCKYHVVRDEKCQFERYFLVKIDEEKVVIWGTLDELKRHITSRRINQDEVYNIECLYI